MHSLLTDVCLSVSAGIRCSPNLLNSAPLTEVERRRLTVDEARPHFSRRVSHRFNESSLSGAGVVAQDQVGACRALPVDTAQLIALAITVPGQVAHFCCHHPCDR